MPLEATRRWHERHFNYIIKSHANQVGGSQIRKKKKKIVSQRFSHIWHQEEEFPKHLPLKSSGAWVQVRRAGGNRLHSCRRHTRFPVHWGPAQSRNSTGAGDPLWLTAGQEEKLQWQKPQRTPTGVSSPDGHRFGIETWPYLGWCLWPDNRQDRNTAPPISRQGASSHTELTATHKHTP